MSSFASSNSQVHPAAGSAAEDPTKSYNWYRIQVYIRFAINATSKVGDNVWYVPNRRFLLTFGISNKKLSDSILHQVGIVSNIARVCVIDLLY